VVMGGRATKIRMIIEVMSLIGAPGYFLPQQQETANQNMQARKIPMTGKNWTMIIFAKMGFV
jgi:hypothetical protein